MTDLSELTQLRLTIQTMSEQVDTERKLFMAECDSFRAEIGRLRSGLLAIRGNHDRCCEEPYCSCGSCTATEILENR